MYNYHFLMQHDNLVGLLPYQYFYQDQQQIYLRDEPKFSKKNRFNSINTENTGTTDRFSMRSVFFLVSDSHIFSELL